ncbi:RICIN domain-containing protein [Kitasatospora sp. KL5]|uniref:RICIN domain-containing protein n=1 Tax=Kitasatospora sp. KL5 TaxID=3425125 RepID=UPI003D6DB93F
MHPTGRHTGCGATCTDPASERRRRAGGAPDEQQVANRNAASTGQVLDVTGVSTADGARLQQWACTGGSARSFRLTAVG